MKMSKQGKGTADHILPLGDWFNSNGLIIEAANKLIRLIKSRK